MEEAAGDLPLEKEDALPEDLLKDQEPLKSHNQQAAAEEEEDEDFGWEDLGEWDARLRQLAADTEERRILASDWEHRLSARLEACLEKKPHRNVASPYDNSEAEERLEKPQRYVTSACESSVVEA